MLAEVVNALFLTYLATEYTNSSVTLEKLFAFEIHDLPRRRSLAGMVVVVLLINLLELFTGFGLIVNMVAQTWKVLHIPKYIVAATLYMLALYWDCNYTVGRFNKNKKQQGVTNFLPRVGAAFVTTLPVYPFLAVLISFCFLFVINIFEYLRLPVELLNWPIYYGTLYGPLSFIYYKVKQDVVQESKMLLPSATGIYRRSSSSSFSGGHRLGSR